MKQLLAIAMVVAASRWLFASGTGLASAPRIWSKADEGRRCKLRRRGPTTTSTAAERPSSSSASKPAPSSGTGKHRTNSPSNSTG
jgi:hypothetical protein